MYLDWCGLVSKKQEKKAKRIAIQQAFIRERRMNQFAYFEANLIAGKQLLDANRDKLSLEELETLDKEYQENVEALEKLRAEWNL